MIVLLSESLGFLTGICQISAHPGNTWQRQAMKFVKIKKKTTTNKTCCSTPTYISTNNDNILIVNAMRVAVDHARLHVSRTSLRIA